MKTLIDVHIFILINNIHVSINIDLNTDTDIN